MSKYLVSTIRYELGPLKLTEREWNELFGAAIQAAKSSKDPVGVIWISQFLELAKREGFELQLSSQLVQTRAVWRN